MKREICTCPLMKEFLQKELDYIVWYFTEKGIITCHILFGFAWGMNYYPGSEWLSENIALEELKNLVAKVENTGIGQLGQDDLFIQFPNLEFKFCNDSDVHIYFEEHSPDIEFFYSRWKELGYQPLEWIKNEKHGSGERVRFN
jgi:hypothetical protein